MSHEVISHVNKQACESFAFRLPATGYWLPATGYCESRFGIFREYTFPYSRFLLKKPQIHEYSKLKQRHYSSIRQPGIREFVAKNPALGSHDY